MCIKICFVVLNYKDSVRVNKLICRIFSFYPSACIFVVNNDTIDDCFCSLEGIENLTVITTDKNLFYTGGHNLAFEEVLKSEFNYVFVINSDVDFEKVLIDDSIKTMEGNKNIGLLSSRMIENDKEVQSCWHFPTIKQYINSNFWYLRKLKKPNQPYTIDDSTDFQVVDVIRGSFQCIRFEALQKVKRYDSNCKMYNFENIFSRELFENGYLTAILTHRYYFHNHIYSIAGLPFRKKIMFEDSKYYLKNFLKANLLQMFWYRITFYPNFLLFKLKCLFRKKKK